MNAPAKGIVSVISPVAILGRLAPAPCLKEVGAAVDIFSAKGCRPKTFASVVAFCPANAVMPSLVEVASRRRYSAKVRNSVVCSVAVDVVNYLRRLFAVMHEPCKPMGKIDFSVATDFSVSLVEGASNRPNFNAVGNLYTPANITRLRAIAQHLTNFLWNNQSIHFVPPYDLARGLGTAIPSTPIIPRPVGYAS